MPAKPPAGVLLMDRPPAPRRVLVTLALAVLLVVAVPASAESIYDETYTESIEATVKTWYTTSSGYERTPNLLYMSKNVVTNNTKQVMTRLPSSYITNYGSLPDEGQNWPVEYKRHDNSRHVGYGEYGYFKLKIGSTDYLQITASFDELDAEAVSGDTIITINSLGSPIIYPSDCYWSTWTEQKYIWSSISTDTSGYKCAFGSIVGPAYSPDYILFAGTNYIFIWGNWQNRLIIESEQQGVLNQSTITLQRVFSDGAHPSEFHVKYGNTTVSKTASTDQFLTIPEEFYPFSTHVKSISGKWHNETFYSDSGGDPGGLTATIYVRDSQTGALIPGATVSILDGLTGTTTNETFTSGSGTISLEKTSTLRYLATATASGYTSLGSIQFGTMDDTLDIILWMSPDAPPDEPIEEGKSMLYGYIQTQGNQQPIAAATVSLDGYGSTTTSSTGFYLFNNITPGGPYTLSASAPLHDALSEPVTVETVATPYNLALKGHFLLTVSAKDADDLTTLHNTTISLSDGQESTQNPATFNVDYGPYTITAAAGGYYPQTQSAYLDKPGTTTATVLLTARPEPVPPPEMPNYPPHNVRFHCIDDFGLPLSNVSVSAAYLETTSPWSWFTDLLGIPSTVAINETTLAGTTGTDGSITFSMVESVRYAITAHDPASNLSVNFTLYPQETQYTIQFRTRPPSDAETHPIYNLEAVPLEGDTQVSLRLAYKDRDNATTSLLFWVKDGAGEYVYTDTLEPTLLNWTNTSYTVENHPASYTWGFDATHATRDTISAARSITLHGSGRLVDLGFEDEFWYLLLSAIWIVGIGAIFSGSRVRFGAIIIPLIGGGVPTLIGWLPLATTVPIGILTFIGVFVYMRKSEYKLYR